MFIIEVQAYFLKQVGTWPTKFFCENDTLPFVESETVFKYEEWPCQTNFIISKVKNRQKSKPQTSRFERLTFNTSGFAGGYLFPAQ